ncbi:MAG TPA: glycosyl hydrolase family 8 [Puia sp.]|nr:glycosyl hydrolase family 8 [Puia sp.]
MQFLRNYLACPSLLCALISSAVAQISPSPARPFPQHVVYASGVHKPDHVGQGRMDDSVRAFYDAWKRRYIRSACVKGQYYIWFEGPDARKQCVSEGQGYGMIIVAMMAGYDPSARKIYDGLLQYARAHPSKASPLLMAWAQRKNCRDVDGSTATDGDLDIAWSLLLAHEQWGENGDIHYLAEANAMIAAIRKQEINQKTFSVLLSNSVEQDSKDYSDMRSSDFMPSHFRAFADASGDRSWEQVSDNNYRLFHYMQERYSPAAGLLPDFINHVTVGTGVPARPHYLESKYDGAYNYNACRVPWRIAMDCILYGDQRSAAIVGKINRWIRSTTQDNPDNISAGYSLAGEDLKNRYYEAMCFISSFSIAAMVGDNQAWLNKLWDYIVHFGPGGFDYYDNSIKMIHLIILSGNYWKPGV